MAEGSRRFPPPWRADKILGGYVVRDANGQALAYIYSRKDGTEALQAKMLTMDEARRIAVNVARCWSCLGRLSTNRAMIGHTEKAERYWALMRKYQDLAEHAEPPFLGDFYRKVARRYGVMAKEALDLADAESRRKG
jgi:hypothetical protein